MKRLRIPAALALGALLALSGGAPIALAAPPAFSAVTAAPTVFPIVQGDKLIVGKATGTKVTVKIPGVNGAGAQVNVKSGYWSYEIPKGKVLTPGQKVTVIDGQKKETVAKVGQPTVVHQPVVGKNTVMGTAEPGTYLTVAIQDKNQPNPAIVDDSVDIVVGNEEIGLLLLGES
ncbi:hypothetical protein [Arcanobacterium hippocoleae]|uniref:hypothetical protein n=1 Tax=Arcanobacterium hippocoleae TaxID=149017 RepID=UPI0033404D66